MLNLVGCCVALTTILSGGLSAQVDPILLDGVENLAFDRPESWAMKYFTSVSLFSGLGTPRSTQAGSVELAFEGGTVPNLGAEKRRVGFVGSKVEDLNRTNLFGRFRATFGLPRDFSFIVGVTPPLEVDGVTPKLLNLALARPLLDTDGWRLGARLHGQLGSIEGDLTCPEDVAGSVDPQVNPQGCLEASNDESTQNYIGLEISATPKIWGERWEPHVAVSANYMDLEFQVRATYSVFDDQERLLADGVTYALTVGLSYQLREKIEVRSAIFYTPLDVVRDPLRGSQNDELINARVILAYSVK
ncbi:MAG: hypothetical protein V3S30_09630 [Thermoanaerobaculia bacterium]